MCSGENDVRGVTLSLKNWAGCIKKRLKLTMISGNHVNQSEQRILYLITVYLQNSD